MTQFLRQRWNLPFSMQYVTTDQAKLLQFLRQIGKPYRCSYGSGKLVIPIYSLVHYFKTSKHLTIILYKAFRPHTRVN